MRVDGGGILVWGVAIAWRRREGDGDANDDECDDDDGDDDEGVGGKCECVGGGDW